jgi:hypothetical protein
MRNILKIALVPVVLGAGLAAMTTAANADTTFRFGINVGPPAYYYAPPPPYYYGPGGCYWDSFRGRVCTW